MFERHGRLRKVPLRPALWVRPTLDVDAAKRLALGDFGRLRAGAGVAVSGQQHQHRARADEATVSRRSKSWPLLLRCRACLAGSGGQRVSTQFSGRSFLA